MITSASAYGVQQAPQPSTDNTVEEKNPIYTDQNVSAIKQYILDRLPTILEEAALSGPPSSEEKAMAVTWVRDRLLSERQYLIDNIAKLEVFIVSYKFKTLKPRAKELLEEQLLVMREYSNVLLERISLIEE